MKAFLLVVSVMMAVSGGYSAGDELFVIANSAFLYAAPSLSSERLLQLEKSETVTLISETENGFLQVEYNGVQGYVYSELVGEVLPEQDIIPTFNATMLNDADVFSLTSDEVIAHIQSGVRVFLYEGYDDEKDFLAIQFEEGGEVLYGRVRIEDVKPDGVNTALIVAITAIVAIVSIIIILLGITKKKRHKKLKSQD